MESYTIEEKVLRKVMRNIPMGLIVSKEGFRRKIYYVNDTACEIMGYTREEYIRKMQDGWADLMDVDLREVIREHNEQIPLPGHRSRCSQDHRRRTAVTSGY